MNEVNLIGLRHTCGLINHMSRCDWGGTRVWTGHHIWFLVSFLMTLFFPLLPVPSELNTFSQSQLSGVIFYPCTPRPWSDHNLHFWCHLPALSDSKTISLHSLLLLMCWFSLIQSIYFYFCVLCFGFIYSKFLTQCHGGISWSISPSSGTFKVLGLIFKSISAFIPWRVCPFCV